MFPSIDIPEGVYHDDGAQFEIADLHRMVADAALLRPHHTAEFADGGTGAGADRAAQGLIFGQCLLTGCIAHGTVGSDRRTAIGKIINRALHHQRNEGKTCIIADAVILQTLHHAVGCRQSVGAAAGQYDGMDRDVFFRGVEDGRFP